MTKLIVTIGAPGAGKTTWSEARCKKRLGKTVIISLDDLRTTLFGNIKKSEFFDNITSRDILPAMKKIMVAQVKALSKVDDIDEIIICNTNTNLDTVEDWISLSKKLGLKFCFKYFDADLKTLEKRNLSRPKEDKTPFHVIESMYVNSKGVVNKLTRRGIKQITTQKKKAGA